MISGCLLADYLLHYLTPDQTLGAVLGIFDHNFLTVFSNLECHHCQSHRFYQIIPIRYWPGDKKMAKTSRYNQFLLKLELSSIVGCDAAVRAKS